MTGSLLCFIDSLSSNLLTVLSIVVSFFTLLAAWYIPRKIMLDQGYIELASQYRSPEMGFAILSIFDFYANQCGGNPSMIAEEYIKTYKKEIGIPMKEKESIDPAKTLQFQRRLVAYFYWDLARLYFESGFPRLSSKRLKQFVESNERNLISIVLQMSEANKQCFPQCEHIPEPPDDEVPMNQLIKRLYDETEDWV